MPHPIIGITTSHTTAKSGLSMISVTKAYVAALLNAGACPLLIPLGLSGTVLGELLSSLKGVLFPGGGDIAPQYYGEQAHASINSIDEERDRLELAVLQYTVDKGLPFLGICRGIQLVNVGLGGTLYSDLLSQYPGALQHDFSPDFPRHYLAHNVKLNPSSRLADIVGQASLQVNSRHHQGIRQLAPGVVATAFAPDGLVEAIELPQHPFGLAVQWHPEWLTEDNAMQALFWAFVQAASTSRD